MESAKISTRKLADESSVDKGTITEWRQGGARAVSVEAVRKVAVVLGTTAEQLLDLPVAAAAPGTPMTPEASSLSPVIGRIEELLRELGALMVEARRAGAPW